MRYDFGVLYLEGRIDGGACFWNFAVVMEDFKQSKYSGSQQCETFGKIYEINLVLTEIWEKESNWMVKLFIYGGQRVHGNNIVTDKLVALRVRENGIAVSLQLLSGTMISKIDNHPYLSVIFCSGTNLHVHCTLIKMVSRFGSSRCSSIISSSTCIFLL